MSDIGGNPAFANLPPSAAGMDTAGGEDFGGSPTGAGAVGTILTGGGAPMMGRVVTAPIYTPPPPVLGPPVPTVSTSDLIRLLQIKLNGMGAHLAVDGVMGPKTQAAMQQYGLDVNGNPVPRAAAPAPPAPTAAGAGAPAGTTAAAPAAANPQDIEEQIRSKYGYLGTVLLDNPEIHKVLFDAISGGWDSAQVQGALMGTNYWKTTQASQRNWNTLLGTDPASANAQIAQQAADIAQTAGKLGVNIAPDRLQQMATDSLRLGWDATQLQQAIGNEFHYTPGPQAGALGVAQGQLKQMAGQYLVPLSDQTLGDWEGQIAKGGATADSFRDYILNQSKGMFPALAKQIDSGMTVQQLADPYRQIAAKDLGVTPDSIDFTDPKWGRALNQVNPQTNTPMMMTQYDWQKTIRSDPAYGFQNGPVGKQLASQMTVNLAQSLGKLAA